MTARRIGSSLQGRRPLKEKIKENNSHTIRYTRMLGIRIHPNHPCIKLKTYLLLRHQLLLV